MLFSEFCLSDDDFLLLNSSNQRKFWALNFSHTKAVTFAAQSKG